MTNVDMKYFIEHKETRMWWYYINQPTFTNTFNGSRLRTGTKWVDQWTNDPLHPKIAYDSKEEAEKAIRYIVQVKENVFVTEHEFGQTEKNKN